jgi:hypothetical protein
VVNDYLRPILPSEEIHSHINFKRSKKVKINSYKAVVVVNINLHSHQLLAHGRRFSPDTLASSTTTTGRHDIAKSGVKHNKSINQSIIYIHTYRLISKYIVSDYICTCICKIWPVIFLILI